MVYCENELIQVSNAIIMMQEFNMRSEADRSQLSLTHDVRIERKR